MRSCRVGLSRFILFTVLLCPLFNDPRLTTATAAARSASCTTLWDGHQRVQPQAKPAPSPRTPGFARWLPQCGVKRESQAGLLEAWQDVERCWRNPPQRAPRDMLPPLRRLLPRTVVGNAAAIPGTRRRIAPLDDALIAQAPPTICGSWRSRLSRSPSAVPCSAPKGDEPQQRRLVIGFGMQWLDLVSRLAVVFHYLNGHQTAAAGR